MGPFRFLRILQGEDALARIASAAARLSVIRRLQIGPDMSERA
jgi:hypothetical protein